MKPHTHLEVVSDSITIVGAGISGSYLGRLLQKKPILYDNNSALGCRCAWGVPFTQVKILLGKLGISLEHFLLCNINNIYMNNVRIRVTNFATIDKPLLIQELRKGLKIKSQSYSFNSIGDDLVVNATGVPMGNEISQMNSYEEKIRIMGAESNTAYAYINPRFAGYAWLFPLDEEGGLFHFGAAAPRIHPKRLMEEMLCFYRMHKGEMLCCCGGPLHLSDPTLTDIVRGNVVAVGGAAGCVNPITGEGIFPALQTADLLGKTLNIETSIRDYTEAVRETLSHYKELYKIYYKLQDNPRLTRITGIRTIFNSINYFEPSYNLSTILKLFWKIARM